MSKNRTRLKRREIYFAQFFKAMAKGVDKLSEGERAGAEELLSGQTESGGETEDVGEESTRGSMGIV